MSVQASYQPMSILTERKGRAGLNVPSRTQKEKRLNEKSWKKERMMNMNESTAEATCCSGAHRYTSRYSAFYRL